jgi:hypothetical protein
MKVLVMAVEDDKEVVLENYLGKRYRYPQPEPGA